MVARFRLACVVLVALLSSMAAPARAQEPGRALSAAVKGQIAALQAEKQGRTAAEQKIDSNLLYGMRIANGQAALMGLPSSLQVELPTVADGRVVLDVRAAVSARLLAQLRGLGAEIIDSSAEYRHVGLRAPLSLVESIAAIPEVKFVSPDLGYLTASGYTATRLSRITDRFSLPALGADRAAGRARVIEQVKSALRSMHAYQDRPMLNTGAVTSQGDVTHRAAEARTAFGVNGTGVKIGVLSDGVNSLATSQTNGELGAVTVLSGQAGNGDEGTAMLEIVHDLAPGAELFYATGAGTITSFAQNIRDLRSAGCDIIVDDIGWLVETPFQDGQTVSSQTNGGVVIQAVKDVAASGALYFSAAANSGRADAGTSGTWEGDYVDGGSAPALIGAENGHVHTFPGGLTYDSVTAPSSSGTVTTLFWADPLGASNNDYDLYSVDSTGTSLLRASTNYQTGTQDPFEYFAAPGAGERLVIVKYFGNGVFLHLATNRGTLAIATGGETHGHAATSAANTFGVAATPACAGAGSTGPCSSSFVSSNKVETFSSDGRRRIFFTESGAAITPGNFSSSGGQLLNKPDITAADGINTSVNGAHNFTTFFGTSAAAPHAAAIAALVKSRNLAQTASQISIALTSTAIDIEGAGFDRNAGYGIVMAYQAVFAATPPAPSGIAAARAGSGSVRISWAAVSGATSYNVGIATTSGGPYSFFSTSGTSLTFNSLTGGLTYYFVVQATNGITTSANSAQVSWLVTLTRNAGDLDLDGKAELAVWRATTGTWYWVTSSTNYVNGNSKQFGNDGLGDKPFTGDIDGDGRLDLIVWRASTGTWFWLTSSSSYTNGSSKQFGNNGLGDQPFVGDFDGDGKTDLAVWRSSTGTWYWVTSTTNYTDGSSRQWGNNSLGDVPMLADVDGDGKSDPIVWRAPTGMWYWTTSSTNYAGGGSKQFGNNGLGDQPLTGDMDGDGKSELIVWRASTGTWYWSTSSTNYVSGDSHQWGNNGLGDMPRPRDIDGDGKLDLVVWRSTNGTWYWLTSSTNYSAGGGGSKQFGNSGLGDIAMR